MLCTCCARDDLPDDSAMKGKIWVRVAIVVRHVLTRDVVMQQQQLQTKRFQFVKRVRFTNKKGKKIAKKAKEQSLRDSHLQSLVVGLGNTTSAEPPRGRCFLKQCFSVGLLLSWLAHSQMGWSVGRRRPIDGDINVGDFEKELRVEDPFIVCVNALE
eukprot:1649165-Amphidinium_carterae.1